MTDLATTPPERPFLDWPVAIDPSGWNGAARRAARHPPQRALLARLVPERPVEGAGRHPQDVAELLLQPGALGFRPRHGPRFSPARARRHGQCRLRRWRLFRLCRRDHRARAAPLAARHADHRARRRPRRHDPGRRRARCRRQSRAHPAHRRPPRLARGSRRRTPRLLEPAAVGEQGEGGFGNDADRPARHRQRAAERSAGGSRLRLAPVRRRTDPCRGHGSGAGDDSRGTHGLPHDRCRRARPDRDAGRDGADARRHLFPPAGAAPARGRTPQSHRRHGHRRDCAVLRFRKRAHRDHGGPALS